MRRIFRIATITAASIFGVLVFCAALDGTAANAATPSDAEQRFAAAEHDYVVFFLARFPVVATYLGAAAFDPQLAGIDGKLRDYSPDALAAEQSELAKFRAIFGGFDTGQLSARWRIDRSVALAQIDFMLHEQQVRKYQQRSLDTYLDEPALGVELQLQGMTATGQGAYGTEAEWGAVLARTQAIPAYLMTAQRELAAGAADGNTPDWRMLLSGLKTAQADADYFSKSLPAIAAKDDPAIAAELRSAGAGASAAYEQLHDFLAATFFDDPAGHDRTALKPAYRSDRYALGEAEYDWALHNNFRLDTSASQLFTEAQPVVEDTQRSMMALARQLASQHGWKVPADGASAVRVVFEELSKDAPKTDGEMLEGYRKVGERLVRYAHDRKLVDVTPDYGIDVQYTPETLRDSVGNAGFYPAPPFKGTGLGRFYVTPTGDDAAALREGYNYPSMAVLAAHEGFPGHGLHYAVMTHWRDGISPIRWLTPGAVEDSSSMWEDSMAIEGWGFYAEALLGEPLEGKPYGVYTPEEKLYQLRGKLLRDLRVRIDTGIHTGRMTFDEAVDLFSVTVDFLPGSCRDGAALKDPLKKASCDAAYGQVSRYSRWPTQAIAYRLGKEQILALRQRVQAELGGAFSLRVFHLALMTQGTVPVSYFDDELIKSMKYDN